MEKKLKAPATLPYDKDPTIVFHPKYGEITVAELVKKLAEEKKVSPGDRKKSVIGLLMVKHLWGQGNITAGLYSKVGKMLKDINITKLEADITTIDQSMKGEVEKISIIPSISFLEAKGYLKKIKMPGRLAFYTITKTGATAASIDTAKAVAIPESATVSGSAEEVAEFIQPEKQ